MFKKCRVLSIHQEVLIQMGIGTFIPTLKLIERSRFLLYNISYRVICLILTKKENNIPSKNYHQ